MNKNSRFGSFRRFARDVAGAALVTVALGAVPLIGFVGIGTDTARGYLVKSRLSSALDAAALAGGRSFFLPTRDEDITIFFNANFPPGYMGATVSGPQITVDEDAETIYLSASAQVATSFMHLFGYDHINVSTDVEVTRQMQALDVVLAIDMSGSMNWSATGGGSRIEAARNAATELVDILFGNNGSKDILNIGLVPWNGKVNVTLNGTTFDSTMTTAQAVSPFTNPETGTAQSVVYMVNNSPVPLLAAPPAEWKGCVFNRYTNDGDDTNDADVLLPPISVGGLDWMAWQPIGPEGEPVSGWGVCSMAWGGSECTPCLQHGITALQNQKQTILDAIADLTNPQGTTNIPEGLGWAWRVLKPDAPFTEAIVDPPYNREQAIVLLTDGENTGGNGDGYKSTFGVGSAATDEMNARLLELADNIKANGVIIYVVQFANGGEAPQTILQQVASGPGTPYYHYAPDVATLQSVFHEIANHLSELRLSK